MYSDNCMVTLTYNDDHLPPDRGLHYDDLQRFMKRLRKRFRGSDYVVLDPEQPDVLDNPIRHYGCGEYGDNFGRPHFHILLFNFDFADKRFYKFSKTGHPLYRSEILEDLWSEKGKPIGFADIASVSFEMAAYVARYCMKKYTNPDSRKEHDHYDWFDPATGEFFSRAPERSIMSKRSGGIGKPWLIKYQTDVYPSDSVVMQGQVMRPPKYYDGVFEKLYPDELAQLKRQRKAKAKVFAEHNTPERLAVRERVKRSKIQKLTRPMH